MREELTDTVSIMNPISYQTSRSMLELVEDKLCELADEYDHARLEEFERYEETVKTLLEIRRYMIIGSNHMDEDGEGLQQCTPQRADRTLSRSPRCVQQAERHGWQGYLYQR